MIKYSTFSITPAHLLQRLGQATTSGLDLWKETSQLHTKPSFEITIITIVFHSLLPTDEQQHMPWSSHNSYLFSKHPCAQVQNTHRIVGYNQWHEATHAPARKVWSCKKLPRPWCGKCVHRMVASQPVAWVWLYWCCAWFTEAHSRICT